MESNKNRKDVHYPKKFIKLMKKKKVKKMRNIGIQETIVERIFNDAERQI